MNEATPDRPRDQRGAGEGGDRALRVADAARGHLSATLFTLGLVACTALALWVAWPALSPGRIVNLDAPRHLLRSVVMAEQFLPAGHVDGWSPYWYLGAQLFSFQSYGYFFAVGASALLLGHFFSIEEVFKFWYLLPLVALPAVTALLALRLGVSRLGALAASVASLTFTSPLGYGIQGLFGMGLLLQAAGVIGFALAWPEILSVLLDRRRAAWRAVLVLAVVVTCHFITGAYTLATAGVVAAGLALGSREAWPLLRYTWVAALVLLVAGHSLFPSLELRELAGQAVGWGVDRDRFDRFLAGTLFGARPLAIAALLAAAWTLRSGQRPLRITAMVLFATALLGGANQQVWEPEAAQKLLEVLFRPRALPYAAFLQAVFVGVAVDLALGGLAGVAARRGRPGWALVAPPVAVALVLLVSVPTVSSQRRFVRTESMIKAHDRRVYDVLVQALGRRVSPPAIVAIPRTLFPQEALGARSVISLLNMDTGLYTLGGDQAELTDRPRRLSKLDLDDLHLHAQRYASTLRAAGVSHVVVGKKAVREGLVNQPDFRLLHEYVRPESSRLHRYRQLRGRDPVAFAIYRLRRGGSWLRGAALNVQGMEHSPERIVWTVQTRGRRTGRTATAAVNWHPNWKASVDGRAVETRRSALGTVSFPVPSGATEVTLEFVRGPREKVYNLISAGSLLFVLVAWAREPWRRRRNGRSPSSASTSQPGERP